VLTQLEELILELDRREAYEKVGSLDPLTFKLPKELVINVALYGFPVVVEIKIPVNESYA